ncbi:hypothetical protein HZH66_012498 [Vespula vulgaris]|uniref:Uncharacterized protein n=1 Tax=Vespula vulgaris TaxID=7454 RepID=A0A834J9Q4_VESVU|nr:hypothetical protein HZH66_012498 [Vespula vulgaris]
MDAANFTLEFTQLLTRYTTSKTPNENVGLNEISKAPLTSATIIQLVQESLRMILPEPYVPNISVSVNKTPLNDIIFNTPDAPFIQRTSLNGNGIISECTDDLSDKLSPKNNKDESPSKFNLKATGRSDTFVQDNNISINKDNDNSPIITETTKEIVDDVFLEAEVLPHYMRLKLDTLRQSAADLIMKIDDIKTINKDRTQSSIEKSVKPIRRLSSIGNYSSATRPSMLRSDQPSKKRRSFITFPGTTPTSSRLNNTVVLNENLSKRKSTSSMSLNVTTTNAIPTKSLVPKQSNVRSHSNLSLPVVKKSPVNDGRPAKNPKYAHIQSSIPKPSNIKKKT